MKSLIKTRLAALGVMLLVFAAGIAVGMVLDRTQAQAAPETGTSVERDRGDREGEGEERRRGWIIERVDLRPDQQILVDSILEDFRERMKTFQRSSSREYGRIVHEAREALKDVLDEDQRARYEALLEERDRRRRN